LNLRKARVRNRGEEARGARAKETAGGKGERWARKGQKLGGKDFFYSYGGGGMAAIGQGGRHSSRGRKQEANKEARLKKKAITLRRSTGGSTRSVKQIDKREQEVKREKIACRLLETTEG